MKQEYLKQLYGTTPDSFKNCVVFALKKTEEQPMKRKLAVRTVLIAAAVLLLLMAAAYAAFSSQVAEFFGRQYGSDMQDWLEKGDVATTNQSFTLDGIIFTLEEVVYRDNGLYGVGTICPEEGSNAVILPEDHAPGDAYGYDVHGAGGKPEEAPADAPTFAEMAQEKGGKLWMVRTLPEQVSVDGGTMLSPGTIGYAQIPQRDGSIRFAFELSDSYAVEAGDTYTIHMLASVCEMTMEGKLLEDTRHGENWVVEMKPTPIHDVNTEEFPQEPVDALPETLEVAAPAEPEVIVLEAYTQDGTLPIYRAAARDFGDGLQPELFNQSGIADRKEWSITFADEAVLDWAPEALFYNEYSGTFDANAKEEGSEPDDVARPALSNTIAGLAASAMRNRPGEEQGAQLEKTALTHITLDEAKATLETLLAQLGVTGYVCDNALDMSVERIVALGNERNAQIESGEYYTNLPQDDFSQVTAEDEGFYLSYHKPGDGGDLGNGDIFSAYAYVTSRGVVDLSLRDMYIPGEVYSTPNALVAPETILEKLPGEVAASRYPEQVVSIASIQLTYAPMRAADKADGMVLAPIWLVMYQDTKATESGYNCWAEFDAVDGKLLNAIFK